MHILLFYAMFNQIFGSGLDFYRLKRKLERMGRGVSSGGGQSSLDYLFGSGEAPKPASNNGAASPNKGPAANTGASAKPTAAAQPIDVIKQIPAGINSNTTNNYHRVDGQNCGNFITV